MEKVQNLGLTLSRVVASVVACLLIVSCDGVLNVSETPSELEDMDIELPVEEVNIMFHYFGSNIQLGNLENYANQPIPGYINKDNTGTNFITDEGATLGRVLFYDNSLSLDRTVSCASCHQQEHAFGDDAPVSAGVAGTTGRHSMRLVNARFGKEERFFWDERANSLEFQTTQPIQDHIEMGFSGQEGDPTIDELIIRLQNIEYYPPLFELAFGDEQITEDRMQLAMAQFIRSIQSFDSRFDEGLMEAQNLARPFDNFTTLENQGKALYLAGPVGGPAGGPGGIPGGPLGTAPIRGAGCNACHAAPEFDIDENSGNNGVIRSLADPDGQDLAVTRSPSLRDLVKANGQLNGPMMHTGDFTSLEQMIGHYNTVPATSLNPNLDPRLSPGGRPQRLNLSDQEIDALVAFLQTLTGTDIYTNPKWSDPFVIRE
ncbi:MAG: cytochrome c peroxidase [Bacteroidota bacterium]